MARRADTKPTPPMFSIKHEFARSLDWFTHEAGMLADAVRTMLQHDGAVNPAARAILTERLAAFRTAQFGDDDTGNDTR